MVLRKQEALSEERLERAAAQAFEHLTPDEKIEVKDEILATLRTPGWQHIAEAIEREKGAIARRLIDRPTPLQTKADYERQLGLIRGLERVEALIDGAILAGEEVERSNQ